MTGKDLYQIETRPSVRWMIPYKSSDFFAVFERERGSNIYIYNLQGMVHSLQLTSSARIYDTFYSEYFGGLLVLDNYDPVVVLRYSWKAGTNNPSCLSSATATAKYSFGNKWCGNKCAISSGVAFTNRGICEFNNDRAFLVYLNSDPPTTLPTNKVGEQLTIRASTAPPNDPLNPNGGTGNTTTTSTTSNSDTLSNGLRDFFLRALIMTIIIVLVIFAVLGLIIYCCVKLTPGAKSYEGTGYQYPVTGSQQASRQVIRPSQSPRGRMMAHSTNNALGAPQPYIPQMGGQKKGMNGWNPSTGKGVPLPGQHNQMSVQMPLNQMGTPMNPNMGALEAQRPNRI